MALNRKDWLLDQIRYAKYKRLLLEQEENEITDKLIENGLSPDFYYTEVEMYRRIENHFRKKLGGVRKGDKYSYEKFNM